MGTVFYDSAFSNQKEMPIIAIIRSRTSSHLLKTSLKSSLSILGLFW
ncbi:22273_t:CDS:2 [Dentiscutata erythropus]|uniref:22273_t:CDS:1 n=1 Tax=Dentiscutata erythropus TaxID=1348616 RepID=A0A9N9CJU0_9GLOM|nr:22273_t:CDS:2 [Dentiscutata erythropus]